MSYQTCESWRKANKPVLIFGIRPSVFVAWVPFIFIHGWWMFSFNVLLTILFGAAAYFKIPPRMALRWLHNQLLRKRKIYRLWWRR